MVYSIVIIEHDNYLFGLLKHRLSYYFPDAYIHRLKDIKGSFYKNEFCEKQCVLYNNLSNSISKTDIEDIFIETPVIPIYNFREDSSFPEINCDVIRRNILKWLGNSFNEHNLLHMLFPFVYINDREEFIKEKMCEYLIPENTLRIDLMSHSRVSSEYIGDMSPGGLSELISLAQRDDFDYTVIPEYCNPTNLGFISPGTTYHIDDVFDTKINTLINLINGSKNLINQNTYINQALIVAEGFRTQELSRLASCADYLHILLPTNETEKLGYDEAIKKISEELSHTAKMSIHYMDEVYAI